MSPEETKAFIRQWVADVWNNRRYERIAELIAPDYVMHSPGQPDIAGPEGFRQFMLTFHTALSDFHMVVDEIVVEGDRAAWRVTTRATQTGPLFGVPPTGRTADTATLIFSRFAGGQWAEDTVLLDVFGLLQQLGAIPAPAGAAA